MTWRCMAARTSECGLKVAGGVPSMFVSWMLSIGKTGHDFRITRDALTDHAQWSRVLRLPEHLGECEVLSGSIRTTVAGVRVELGGVAGLEGLHDNYRRSAAAF